MGFGHWIFYYKSEAMADDEQRDIKRFCPFYIILLEKYHQEETDICT